MEIAIFKSDLWHNHVKKKNKSCKKRRSPAGDKKKKNDIQPRSDKKKVLKKVSGTSPKAKGINTNQKIAKEKATYTKKKRRYKTKKIKTTSARSSSPTDQYAGRGTKTSKGLSD